MDRQLAERMVGAACLLAVLVLVVPSILDGNQEPESTGPEPVLSEVPDQRTHTLILDDAGARAAGASAAGYAGGSCRHAAGR